ncbi:MAG: hypothetical protein ACP5PV_05945 [Methanothrix sp.]
MKKISIGLVMLAGCLVLLGCASGGVPPVHGDVTVEAKMEAGVGIDVQNIDSWPLSIGSNPAVCRITVYQFGGSSLSWSVSAADQSNGGQLTSIGTPLDKLSPITVEGKKLDGSDGSAPQVWTGTIGADGSTSKDLALSQVVTYLDNPHDDYHLTITYTLTY